jgi:hypothetical protein
MNTAEIENILRKAPRPVAPAGLKGRLEAQASAARRGSSTSAPMLERRPGSWFARWWPALAPAAASLACAAVFTAQQIEIRDLRAAIEAAPPAEPAAELPAANGDHAPTESMRPANSSTYEQEEIARLRASVDTLTAEVSRLEKIAAENVNLRKQLAAGASATLTAEEAKGLEEARERAMSIQCVNNMKQLGLAARIWAVDHGDTTPASLLQMTNEMSTPKILFCPADTGRQAAANWTTYTPANCSYEYLAPSAPDTEPTRVMFRCPVHGSLGLCDGSVQKGVGKTHPEWLIQRDGKLYLEPSNR